MGWIAIIVIAIVIFTVVSAGNKTKEAQEKTEFSTRTIERSLAYRDYLRRTSNDPNITAMSDNELNEFIATNIRDYNKQSTDLTKGSGTLGGAAIFAGLVMWGISEEGGVGFLVGATLLCLVLVITKKERTKLDASFGANGLPPYPPRH